MDITESEITFLELAAKHFPSALATGDYAKTILKLIEFRNNAAVLQDEIDNLEERVQCLETEKECAKPAAGLS